MDNTSKILEGPSIAKARQARYRHLEPPFFATNDAQVIAETESPREEQRAQPSKKARAAESLRHQKAEADACL